MPKPRKMLSDWDAAYLQPLVKLIETQSKATLADWAVTYAERVLLPLWSKEYPGDLRPQEALCAARDWLAGAIKLPQAKAAILACHAAAREAAATPAAQAAARAIGQSASTIHAARHCIGLPLYGAVAAAYDALGTTAPWGQVEQRAAEECAKMLEALRAVAVQNEPHPGENRLELLRGYFLQNDQRGYMEYTQEELKEALRAITSLISKCEKAQEKLRQGTSQWTLLRNRIKAFHISSSLITKALEE